MTDTAGNFIETYERERASLPAANLGWLNAKRDAAMKAFAQAGLPHRRLEDWRYTDLARVLDKASLATMPSHKGDVNTDGQSAVRVFGGIDRHIVMLVNGELRGSVSLPDGVDLLPLSDVLAEPWAQSLIDERVSTTQAADILSLNTGLMRGGMGLHIAKGVKLEKPLHLIYLAADDGAIHLRNLIRLEEGAQATIYESFVGAGSYFTDHATTVSLAGYARLSQIRVQDEAPAAIHLSTTSAMLAERAHLSNFTLSLGSALSRGQTFVRFDGEDAEAHVNGATALKGRQHGDQFCIVDHAVPRCTSATLFRTVLDDASTGVFQGRVVVRPHAQKTDGRQMTNALLLSRDAAMNAKPELEIYADDVQCAHGSTIGELNAEALFYLRSRGIDEQTARQLLITAFLDEALETIPDEAARDGLRELVADWFQLTVKEGA